MKLSIGFLLSSLVALFAIGNLSAAEVKLQKVRELGVMKNKVIFQSRDVKFVKKSMIVRGKIVAQWGMHLFEVGNAFYACNQKKYCSLADYERLAMYESCKVSKNKVTCSKKISGQADIVSDDVVTNESPDSIGSDYDVENGSDDLNEFPARIQDEFSDIF